MLDNMYEKRTVIIYACDCECFAKKSVCHMISTSLELSAFKLPIQKFNSMEASMESFSSPPFAIISDGPDLFDSQINAKNFWTMFFLPFF